MVRINLNLTIIIMTTLICITGLESFALYQGIDGVILTGVIGSLAAIPTWFVARKITAKKHRGRKRGK